MGVPIAADAQATDEQFRLLVESITDYAIFLLDPQGRVATWNAGAARIKGYSAPEIVGRHFSVFYLPGDRESGAPAAALRAAAASGRHHAEGWRVRKDGSRFRADAVLTALRAPDGTLRGFAKVTRDVTERERAALALRESEAGLQALSRRLVEAEEAERRRIARELHDRVGQNLSALNINLDIVLGALGAAGPTDLRVRLRDSLALVDGTLQAIENVMAELRPPLLDEYGLGAALGWHAEDFARRTGIGVALEDEARERILELPRERAVALFRIAQEAMNNTAKHARARSVVLSLAVEDERLVFAVANDGAGLDPGAAPAARLGMKTMRERAEAAGGELEVDSAPGRGTKVTVRVPF